MVDSAQYASVNAAVVAHGLADAADSGTIYLTDGLRESIRGN